MTTLVGATDSAIEAWLNEGLNLERAMNPREFKLDRVRRVLPHLPAVVEPLVTVTGSKGKGSTLRLIEAALLAGGRSTVSFTSPHLTKVTERWRLDGVPAAPEVIAQGTAMVIAAEQAAGETLSYFERCFAMALVLAAARPTARLLLEVGLGGRLDCANTLDAKAVVLTHLSREHCQLLGPTVQHIAREKLALCRPGRPVIIAPQSAEGNAAVSEALPLGSPAIRVGRHPTPFALALLGEHQQDNASTALAALAVVEPDLDEATARRGFATASLGARCQLVEQAGRHLLIDGAHNAASLAATLAVAQRTLRPGWRLLLGMAKDKEADEMLASIPAGIPVHRVAYNSPRSRQADHWPAQAATWPFHADITAALAALPSPIDACITGSLYLAGEAQTVIGGPAIMPG